MATALHRFILRPTWKSLCFVFKHLWRGVCTLINGTWKGTKLVATAIHRFILRPTWKGLCFVSVHCAQDDQVPELLEALRTAMKARDAAG